MLAFTSRALIEILRWVLSRDHPNFKNYIITAGANPSDRPPLEEGPNPNTIKLGDFTFDNFSSNPLGVCGHVVIRREGDLARAAEVDGEVTRGIIDGVA